MKKWHYIYLNSSSGWILFQEGFFYLGGLGGWRCWVTLTKNTKKSHITNIWVLKFYETHSFTRLSSNVFFFLIFKVKMFLLKKKKEKVSTLTITLIQYLIPDILSWDGQHWKGTLTSQPLPPHFLWTLKWNSVLFFDACGKCTSLGCEKLFPRGVSA